MSDSESDLARRIEALAERAPDGDESAAGAPTAQLRDELAGLSGEVRGLREQVGSVRASVDDGAGQLTVFDGRIATVEDALGSLAEQVDALARDGAGVTSQRLDELAELVRGALRELGGALDRGLGGLSSSLDERLPDELGERLAPLRRQLDEVIDGRQEVLGEVTWVRDRLAEHFDADAMGALRADLADALEEIRDRVAGQVTEQLRGDIAAELAAARAAVEQRLDEVRDATDAQLTEVRGALSEQNAALRSAVDGLTAGIDRIAVAGRGLLGYLAERDRLLEAERDEMLHAVLDEFAEGLSAKERRTLSSRFGAALDRRRDARDAQRWRAAAPAGRVDEEPPDLSVYAEPEAPSEDTGARSATSPGETARKPASSRRTAKKSPGSPAKAAKKTPATRRSSPRQGR